MELDVVNQASCHDTKGSSVELKLENEKSPEQRILESKDNVTMSLGNNIVGQHAENSSNKLFHLIFGNNSTDHNQLLEIKENPNMSGSEFVVNGSNETLTGLVLPEDLKQEFEDDSSMSEIKYVNTQDYLEIGETVITSSVETLPKEQNSTANQMKPYPAKQTKPCSETIEVVPCAGLKCAQQLLERGKLRTLSPFQKAKLILAPRPTPDMQIKQIQKKCTRKFQRSIYKTSWLTGCSHVNKVFCWCCMLFSDDLNRWGRGGYNDLTNLSSLIKKHQTSQQHLLAAIAFHNFGKQRSSTSISRKTSVETTIYNMKVDHNRSVFKRLVDVVCHLAQMELPFRSQDESETSLNKGNFLELVILLSKYDQVLAKQLQESGTSYLTHKMQSDIIRSVSDVANARIEAEIRQSQFVSVIVDETRVANERDQLFIVFRYSLENKIYERFMGFIDCTVDELSQAVLGVIKKHECEKKLIAQSYVGTSLSATIRNGVQLQVKEVSPQAIYVWCDPHSLNVVLSKSCSRIDDVSSFFFSLFDLANFFGNNEKRLLHYDLFCSKRLPAISPANRWSYLSCIVNTAYEQKRNLRNLFTKMKNEPQNWDRQTNYSVEILLSFVTSVQFHFYLEVFESIFKNNDSLNCVEQISQIDLLYLTPQIDELKTWLNTFKSQFHVLYQNALQDLPSSQIFPCASSRYNLTFVQIIENITAEINDRYQDTSNLRFLQLLNKNHFKRNDSYFPKKQFDTFKMLYGDHFDTDALKNQLMCIYSAKEMKTFNLSELVEFVGGNTLKDAFSELLKLTDLVATIPATCSAERGLSNLNKRVHAYLSNVQGQDSPTDLATISIEKELLRNLRYSNTFYDDVIKSFSSKNRSFALKYK